VAAGGKELKPALRSDGWTKKVCGPRVNLDLKEQEWLRGLNWRRRLVADVGV